MGIDVNFVSHIKEVTAEIEKTAKERMEKALYELQSYTMLQMTESKGGRTYTHYFWTDKQGRLRRGRERWKPHTASAEGAYPARDTGELIQHLLIEIERIGKDIVGRFGTDRKSGLMLEFGTKNMAPRPWLRPTFERKQKDVEEIFMRRWF